MDSFYGCYKDGTEPGTRDCRWFVSLFYILRFLGFLIALFTLNVMNYIIGSMLLVLFAILMIIIRPFKADLTHYMDINVVFILLLALFYITVTGIDITNVIKSDVSWIFHALIFIVAILPLYICYYLVLDIQTQEKNACLETRL